MSSDTQLNIDMSIDTQPADAALGSNLIADIDDNGYLVNNVDSDISLDQDEDNLDISQDEDNVRFDQDEDNLSLDQDQSDEVLGKIFETNEEAYTFYNRYALLHGFGVRVHWTHKKRATNEIYRRSYVCNKEGFKDIKECDGNKKRRRDTRTGCGAMLRIKKRDDGRWFVDLFNKEHNHPLNNTPAKVLKHRSHSKVHRLAMCKSIMSQLSQSSMRPSQIKTAVNDMESPHEVDVTSKQCSDVSLERKRYKGQEFYGLIKHFHDKGKVDNNQYFEVELFSDGSPKNMFWADGRSRDSYVTFGDVIVLDVAYVANKYRMPFASFVGVNNHGQTILLGAALLENEKEETFIWLFENFRRCMFDKPPSAIITDQDKAIGNAISKVFPDTRHCYCSWYIQKHELEHLRTYRAHYSDFQTSYSHWVNSETIAEFEALWDALRDKYDIRKDSWLADMYNKRSHWAKAFLKDVFFAGMTTSERSESIHSFFDGYVNANTMLNEFLKQYDKAVEARRAAEEDEDFKTFNTKAVLGTTNEIEARAGECYTRKMFDFFQKEWVQACNNVSHETVSKSLDVTRYRVGLTHVDKEHWRSVDFCISDRFTATCSCAKFESHGILCKHILYVMKRKCVPTLPDHYILPRWTIDVRHKSNNASNGLEELDQGNGVSLLSVWRVQSICTKVIEEARDSKMEFKRLHMILAKFLEEQIQRKNASEDDMSTIPQPSYSEIEHDTLDICTGSN